MGTSFPCRDFQALLTILNFMLRIFDPKLDVKEKEEKKLKHTPARLALYDHQAASFELVLLFTFLCCLPCFIFFCIPGPRPVVTEFSLLSLQIERERELKAAEKRTQEKGWVRYFFGIFSPWFSGTTRGWYFQGKWKETDCALRGFCHY